MTAPVVPGQTDAGLKGQLARLLQLAANGLDAAGRPVPGLIYRAAHDPPLDCELLVIHMTRRFAGMPGGERVQVTPSHTPGSSIEAMITLARLIQGMPEATHEPVPTPSMDGDGAAFADDADALWSTFVEAAQDPTRYLNRMVPQSITTSSEGDMAALRLTIQVLAEQTPPGTADV